jgi:hypothetical protein
LVQLPPLPQNGVQADPALKPDRAIATIDLRMKMNGVLSSLEDDVAALDRPLDPGPRRAREAKLLADTLYLKEWRVRWLAHLAVHYRAILHGQHSP